MRQAARDRTGTIGGGKRTTRRSGTARDGYRAATMPRTPLDAHGYLEGAVETGERAASQVATAIG
jgi:hypothetical protein